jgi:hypothetical protein
MAEKLITNVVNIGAEVTATYTKGITTHRTQTCLINVFISLERLVFL